MAGRGAESKQKRSLLIWVVYGLSALFSLGGVALLVLFYTSIGASLKDVAFANGQQARILIETRAVEGNLASLPSATSETTTDEPAVTADVPLSEEVPTPLAEGEESLGSEGQMEEESVVAPSDVTPSVEDQLPPPNVVYPLNGALNSALQETVKGVGNLPVISKSGQESWQYYGKEDKSDTAKPAIAIVVTGLGLSNATTGKAVRLPEHVSLSFSPYAGQLQQQITRARTYGHEVWLDLPLEPKTYPASDVGPLTLLKDLPEKDITKRLHTLLASAATYVGLVGTGAEVFSDYSPMHSVAKELKDRGLLLMLRSDQYAEADTADHVAYVTRTLDALPDGGGASVEQLFLDLEAAAKESGAAVGILSDSPQLYELVSQWAITLEGKGFTLVPASAIISRQKK